ncbi:signal transduction histidine kinase [Chitinivorax tropicus]|uniref:Signal transduction histidine kinase n=1 Tax=Chitinivorax tropicus TaxID=714531 RepID=A0A840MG72_9PROT|nr:histidine kinase [Chitinivorax tropicus]MBB5017400.1 signal transduction histidine kinase [Chitinivorax tropicus]
MPLNTDMTTRNDPYTLSRHQCWRYVRNTFAINTIAGVIFSIMLGDWLRNMAISHVFGWSQFLTLNLTFMALKAYRPPVWLTYTVGATIGVFLGVGLNMWLLLPSWYDALIHRPSALAHTLVISFCIVVPLVLLFSVRDRLRDVQLAFQQKQAEQADIERRATAAQLKMLQAQIEPHFLFNTLANVISLIDYSPDQAKAALIHFNNYLRASLQRTRAHDATLSDELDLIRHYLSILQIRMGARLQFQIDCPPPLLGLPFPPMLVQPLVENAITHGLEPKIEGGTVQIQVRRMHDQLILSVTDNGLGWDHNPSSPGHGVALHNIRERLQARFGDQASLQLQSNNPGVAVTLTMPLGATSCPPH